MGRPITDILGMKFGKLHVTGISGKRYKAGNILWICKCECGSTTEATATKLKHGEIVSCGCFRRTKARTHGMSHTKLYAVWAAMRQRCNNDQHKDYRYYGGKGVAICADWDDFINFHGWALANGFKHGLTIDRIDPNGDYEPENCRFITIKEQQSNKLPRWRHGTLCGYKNHACRCTECRSANAAAAKAFRAKNAALKAEAKQLEAGKE